MSEEKEICPYCGRAFKRLSAHLPYCKEKPEGELTEDQDGYGYDYGGFDSDTSGFEDFAYVMNVPEYTISEDPIEDTPDEPCPYLVVIAGNACSNCRGASCMASKDKKISDPDYCRYEWQDCLLYLDAVERGVRTVCPYFGTPPEGKQACRGLWCYAKDYGLGGVIKSVKRCRQWTVCGRYLESKSAGIPFHRRRL